MIGVFDSGLGGLSILAAIAKALPFSDLIYFADIAHVPYGDKDDAYILQRTLNIGRHLAAQGCSTLVLACNTATAVALPALRDALPTASIIGVEPGVKPAAASTQSGHIAVLATESTARSERLARLIRNHAAQVKVSVLACPGWATKVESLQFATPDFVAQAAAHLAPLLAAGADQIVLGCTHYYFLTPVLAPIVVGRASLIDVADAVARQCLRQAKENALSPHPPGRLFLQASADPERLSAALSTFGLHALQARLAGTAQRVAV